MEQRTEQTPLVSNQHMQKEMQTKPWRTLSWHVAPYFGLAFFSFCLNFAPLALYHPYFQEKNWSEKDFIVIRFAFLLLPGFLQKSLWAPVALVANDIAFLDVHG
ncbi:hypothetical protein BKA67DRAFT_660182 [Truncatella angustata]|uniref:Uncharacterized protein n=1 Tax=Truncatella angustata TaxID=152316 RepID=A0A9P8UJH6_9PEZI|nr:uncharacterized protein BKA67DRAFT_660182 [Truncatella angustata]KAH6653603.1 hypothetical protein BKA67DRAFT_660182 [Truncatella angustata]